jgi:hypothetical protein
MSATAAPRTPSRSRESIVPKPAPPPRRSSLDQAALNELRNAGATFDFLRKKGDPAQFWEMLRLARSRRVIIAPPTGEAPPPSAELEAAIVHELDLIRRQHESLVRDLRTYLANTPGLPEPPDRLEFALAFLLASPREHQAVAKWLAEPGKHDAKAAEKLRSMAAITDPYREALQPWTLNLTLAADPEVQFSEIEEPAPPPRSRAPAPSIDPELLVTLRRAMECAEILSRVHLDAELWEMTLVAATNPKTAQSVLEQLSSDLEGDLIERARVDGLAIEALYQAATDLRGMYGDWVQSLRAFLEQRKLSPEDSREFDVGLGLMLNTPGAQDRLESWLRDPDTWQEEALGLLHPWMRRAKDYLAALK